MKLLLDIGNTQLKWAVLADGELRERGRLRHAQAEPAALLRSAWRRPGPPAAVIAANVAGRGTAERIRQGSTALWQLKPLFVTASAEAHGLRCAYAHPERLGADRWAAMIGARHALPGLSGQALCVLDCGTAVTVDAVSAEGRHAGGLIAPGLELMRRSLHSATSDIAERARAGDAAGRDEGLLATDTREAVEYGVRASLAGLVRHVLDRLARQWVRDFAVVATGGDAPLVQAWLPPDHRLEPDLVLKGLAVIGRGLP